VPTALAAFLALSVSVCAAPLLAAEPPADQVGAFRAECAAKQKAADAAGSMTVLGKDGWMFFGRELRHVSVGAFWGDLAATASSQTKYQDPLPAILDYHASCRKLGIELIVLPIPPKAIVYADKLSAGVPVEDKGVPPRMDTAHQAFYKLLREKGVTVLDLTGDFLAARAEAGTPPVYCKQDTHWSGRACEIAARKIAEHVRDRPWAKALARNAYETRTMAVEIRGDLWRDVHDAKPPAEKVPLRFVGTKSAGMPAPLAPDPNSPVILLGDSHGLVFHEGGEMHAKGAGLVDQLAFELGWRVERLARKGSGATPARIDLYRKQKRLPGYLRTKKLIVWCFSAREFTEAGWRNVPVTR